MTVVRDKESFKPRVIEAVDYLKRKGVTEEAFKSINLTTLNMRSGQECILGQLFGDYHVGLEWVDLNDIQAAAFGFILPVSWDIIGSVDLNSYYDHRVAEYEQLRLAWFDIIREMR